jgi:uncharacterized protein (DUF58 family)
VSALLGADRSPARPGPGAVPETVLRALELTLATRIEGVLSGDYASRRLGRGTELAQIRPYEPETDDVRLIDWKVTARTGVPHVRVQLAERVLVTWVLLDTSASMDFGTAARRKADVAEGVALTLGYAATRRGNRVGAVVFGEKGTTVRPPRHGYAGMMGLFMALGDGKQAAPETSSLADALARVGKVARQRALVVLVSDFRGPRDWRRPLLDLAGRHELVAVEIADPRERELPDVGEIRLVDPETGRHVTVETSNATFRRRFAAAAAEERREVALLLASAGARHVVLDTESDWLRVFVAFLRGGPPQ